MLLTGGGVGVGGWVFKDHPQVQALWTLVTGNPAADDAVDDSVGALAKEVVDRLKPAESFSASTGTYQVTIRQVHLDPNLFRAGRTVDIQARVLKPDGHGRSTTLWDTSRYGERLAVAGKDELIAEWDHEPFQVEWSPGDQLTLEVYDGRAHGPVPPSLQAFVLARFPLRAPRISPEAGDLPAPGRGPETGPAGRPPERQRRPRQPSRGRPVVAGPRSHADVDRIPARRWDHRHQVSPIGPKEQRGCPSD